MAHAVWQAIVRARPVLMVVLLLGACDQERDPPPTLFFNGLPVSGSIADARRTGFDACFNMDAVHVRCRREDVMLGALGPFEAAVDLDGGYGEGGFDQLVLWHKRDNYAVYAIADALEHAGWRFCYTGDDRRGDQIIYTRPGTPFRVSVDLSYFAKRRLRLIPHWNRRERQCTPMPTGSTMPPSLLR